MLIFILHMRRALRVAAICTAAVNVLCAVTGSYAKGRERS
jgi:hypothetical protein